MTRQPLTSQPLPDEKNDNLYGTITLESARLFPVDLRPPPLYTLDRNLNNVVVKSSKNTAISTTQMSLK